MWLGEHIDGIDENEARFRYTEIVAEVFEKRNIYFAHDGDYHVPRNWIFHFRANIEIEPYTAYTPYPPIFLHSMGAFSNTHCQLPYDIVVGRYCSIARGTEVFGFNHPAEWATTSGTGYRLPVIGGTLLAYAAAYRDLIEGGFNPEPYERQIKQGPIVENDVWIGQNVQLARGITVGNGAIIGAGAVVTKNVAPYAVVAGNPARVIRLRFPEKLIERFLASKWWEYDVSILKACDYRNPEKFLDDFDAWKSRPGIAPFTPTKVTCWHILDDIAKKLGVQVA